MIKSNNYLKRLYFLFIAFIISNILIACHGDPKYISKTKPKKNNKSKKIKIPKQTQGILAATNHSKFAIRPFDLKKALIRRHWIPVLYFTGERVVRNILYLNMAKKDPKNLKCETQWRAYLWNDNKTTIIDFQNGCSRMVINGISYILKDSSFHAAKTLITMARLTAQHRLIKVNVPVMHEPYNIMNLLKKYTIAVLPDYNELQRFPWFEVHTWGASGLPKDLSKLDEYVKKLRNRLKLRLTTFSEIIKKKYVGRIHSVEKPFPVKENFRRELTAVWGMRILCELGTPYDMMVVMASFPKLELKNVVISDSYPVYIILDGKSGSITSFTALISTLDLDPPLQVN